MKDEYTYDDLETMVDDLIEQASKVGTEKDPEYLKILREAQKRLKGKEPT